MKICALYIQCSTCIVSRQTTLPPEKKWDVPDRLTGYTALSELNPRRHWNFIEVNVTAEQLKEAR